MSGYVTLKEKCEKLRQQLKQIGISNKQVSVRGKDVLYDDAIEVTIKDIYNIDFNVVEKLADAFEVIRYCERSWEILSGCNTYVNVSYDWRKFNEAQKTYYDVAQEINDILETWPKSYDGLHVYEGEKFYFYVSLYDQYMNKPALQVIKRLDEFSGTFAESYMLHDKYLISEALLRIQLRYKVKLTPEQFKVKEATT